jgi:phosphoglycerate dehydrogenase-like enzyme
MKTVNVVVTQAISEECFKLIKAVSPLIKVTDAAELAHADRKGDQIAKTKLDALLAEAEVVFTVKLPRDLISRASKMKWLQVMSAGADRYLAIDEVRNSPVLMTGVSGIHAVTISEFVMGLMLMFNKRSLHCLELKQQHKWERFSPGMLHSKTLGVVGLGHIGNEVARLGKAFGMKVIATRRSAKPGARARYADILLPTSELPQLLASSDFVALSLPYTTDTYQLIGEKELRTMKPTAYLINIARGGIVDEAALIRALSEKWIAGAGLDVFATEPLPADSELWDMPNVIFSPHISGDMEDYNMRASLIFRDNLQRYLTGKKLKNVINKSRGY